MFLGTARDLFLPLNDIFPDGLDLLKHVIRAPLRFFESTSHGTILNRFAADMARVDGFLPDDWARVSQNS